MGKMQKDGGQQRSWKGPPKPKPDLPLGRQVPSQGGPAATSAVFTYTPFGTYLLHKAMAQDLKKERLVGLAKLEGGIIRECERERVDEIKKGGTHR